MEAKEWKNPDDLNRYLPIENGGWWLASFVFVITPLYLWYLARSWAGVVEAAADLDFVYILSFALTYIFTLVPLFAIGILRFQWYSGAEWRKESTLPWPLTYLSEYWRRNVRGYNFACWHNYYRKVCFAPVKRGEKRPVISGLRGEYRKPFITFPLGGWGRRRGGLWDHSRYGLDGEGGYRIKGWTVKRCGPVNLGEPGATLISRIDDEGQSLTQDVHAALNHFTYCFYSRQLFLWRNEIPKLLREIAQLQAHREKDQEMLAFAVKALKEAVDELDASKRFIKSKEAQRLRERLLDDISCFSS